MRSGLSLEFEDLIRQSFTARARLVVDQPALGGVTLIATDAGFVRLEWTGEAGQRKVTIQGGTPAAIFTFEISRATLLGRDCGDLVIQAFARAYAALLATVAS